MIKKRRNLQCKCESFYQEFLTLDIVMAESENIQIELAPPNVPL